MSVAGLNMETEKLISKSSHDRVGSRTMNSSSLMNESCFSACDGRFMDGNRSLGACLMQVKLVGCTFPSVDHYIFLGLVVAIGLALTL